MENAIFNDTNPMRDRAWEIINHTSANLFLTGRAGTGKTTFLKALRKHSSKNIVVVAPTGIAAINAQGVTIHSFFQLSTSMYVPGITTDRRKITKMSKEKLRLIRAIDLLVIDEVSMVRADLLDAVDDVLRRLRNPERPFGGVQLLLVGDLYQLPPVVRDDEWNILQQTYDTPYFFSSQALKATSLYTIELQTTYRQRDAAFIDLLNHVRDNRVDAHVLKAFNTRYNAKLSVSTPVRIVTHNAQADRVNESQLLALPGRTQCYTASVEGDFSESAFPAEQNLMLKPGAQVMFLRNDPEQRYVNGMIGKVLAIDKNSVKVRTTTGTDIDVQPAAWENIRYAVDDQTGNIREQVQGKFKQLPLRLAWAITVHKSQGLTFDHAIMNLAGSFAHGQAYVALSRCRTLEGLSLEAPLSASAVMCDPQIVRFMAFASRQVPDDRTLQALRKQSDDAVTDDIFSLGEIRRTFNALHRAVEEYLAGTYRSLSGEYTRADQSLRVLEDVTYKFAAQRRNNTFGPERITAAAHYFNTGLKPFSELAQSTPDKCDNAMGTKMLVRNLDAFTRALFVRRHILANLQDGTVSMAKVNRLKAQALAILDRPQPKKKAERTKKAAMPADIKNQDVFKALVAWRTALMVKHHIPTFIIVSTKALIAAANALPVTLPQLRALPNWGPVKVQQYGQQVLDVIASTISNRRQ